MEMMIHCAAKHDDPMMIISEMFLKHTLSMNWPVAVATFAGARPGEEMQEDDDELPENA